MSSYQNFTPSPGLAVAKRVAVLQSGFLAADAQPCFVLSTNKDTSVVDMLKGRPLSETTSPYLMHGDLNQLFNELQSNPRLISDFAFRERYLQAIKQVMCNVQFDAWCHMQRSSPHLSSLHKEFIADTLRYFDTNVRKVAIETWKGLIVAGGKNVRDESMPYDLSYFDKVRDYADLRNSGVVATWMQRNNGIMDLFWFFGIVYGEHAKAVGG